MHVAVDLIQIGACLLPDVHRALLPGPQPVQPVLVDVEQQQSRQCPAGCVVAHAVRGELVEGVAHLADATLQTTHVKPHVTELRAFMGTQFKQFATVVFRQFVVVLSRTVGDDTIHLRISIDQTLHMRRRAAVEHHQRPATPLGIVKHRRQGLLLDLIPRRRRRRLQAEAFVRSRILWNGRHVAAIGGHEEHAPHHQPADPTGLPGVEDLLVVVHVAFEGVECKDPEFHDRQPLFCAVRKWAP